MVFNAYLEGFKDVKFNNWMIMVFLIIYTIIDTTYSIIGSDSLIGIAPLDLRGFTYIF